MFYNWHIRSNKNFPHSYFFEIVLGTRLDVQYPTKWNDLHNDHGDMFIISPCNDLGFLPEKVKIEKVEKLAIANLLDEKEFVIQVNLKQTLN